MQPGTITRTFHSSTNIVSPPEVGDSVLRLAPRLPDLHFLRCRPDKWRQLVQGAPLPGRDAVQAQRFNGDRSLSRALDCMVRPCS